MTTVETIRQQLRSRVAVLYGGTAAERDVSLVSGKAVFDALTRVGIDAELIDTRDPHWWRRVDGHFAHAFIVLHGPGGEDGTVQGLLQSMGVSYTGSGVRASALAMDKLRTKQLWRGVGLSTPDFDVLTERSDFDAIAARWGAVMVKPAHEGSSIGMARASSGTELRAAFAAAQRYDAVVLAERCIVGAEFTVAVLGGRALPAIRLETDSSFYDYEAKYIRNDTRYICPCGLPDDKLQELEQLALAAFDSIGCSGWGRVDVMQESDGRFFLLEVNTVPGMTDHSLVPMAARAAGLDFDALVLEILRLSVSGADKGHQGALS